MQAFVKKVGIALLYFLFLLLGIWIFKSDALSSLLNSDQGILIQVMLYFKDADVWSLIFFTITFGFAFGIFFLLGYGIDKLFTWLVSRFPRLKFLTGSMGSFVQLPLAFLVLLLLFVVGSNLYVSFRGQQLVVDSIDAVPANSPVFILGTSKYLGTTRNINLYYKYRMDAALQLWKSGKVKFFILSGDGVGEAHTEDYDETKEMRTDLLAAGVPDEKIKIDPFGFNTQQSILRLRGVFRLNNIVIISQDFHTRRATVLCDYYSIHSQSFDAAGSASFAMNRKEFLMSRPRLIIDILYANMQPRVTTDGDFAYREEFSATKSNRHVGIVLLMIALFVVALIGYGIYTAKSGPERRKVAIRMSVITSSLTIVLFVLVIQTYKNLDIKFIDEIVEVASEQLGIGNTMVEEKKQKRLEVEQQAELASLRAGSTTVVTTNLPTNPVTTSNPIEDSLQQESIAKQERKKNLFNTEEDIEALKKFEAEKVKARLQQKADSLAAIEIKAKEAKEKKRKNLFNSSDESAAPVESVTHFRAKVHGPQKFKDNQEVTFRTVESVDVLGAVIPENYVFQARANVFNNRIHFIITAIDQIPVDGENYQNNQKGLELTDQLVYNTDSYLLSDGMVLTFGFKAK